MQPVAATEIPRRAIAPPNESSADRIADFLASIVMNRASILGFRPGPPGRKTGVAYDR
jgi:hypothetical protein